jgi:hypothetical protein
VVCTADPLPKHEESIIGITRNGHSCMLIGLVDEDPEENNGY